jgi:hypothetical protein
MEKQGRMSAQFLRSQIETWAQGFLTPLTWAADILVNEKGMQSGKFLDQQAA